MGRKIKTSTPTIPIQEPKQDVQIAPVKDIKAQALALKGTAQDMDTYIPEKIADVLHKALESIDDRDFRNAELKDKAFFIDRMFDKYRLATGRSTAQVDVVHMLSRLTAELNPSAPIEEVKEIVVEVKKEQE